MENVGYMVWMASDSDIASAERGRGTYGTALRYADCKIASAGLISGHLTKGLNITIETSDCDIASEGDPKGSEESICNRTRHIVIGGKPLRSEEEYMTSEGFI